MAIGNFAQFCDQCRAARRGRQRRYKTNERIDDAIIDLYTNFQGRQAIKDFAAKIRWPYWQVKKRARELGLAKTKEKPWNDAELAILERFAWQCPQRIRLRLKAAGFSRTETAIQVKLKRTGYKQGGEFYTARGLASAFGCDCKTITRWISLGFLKAQKRGTARTEAQGGDMWLIKERDVKRFILENPMVFDLRKVDQLWFLNLITGGKIGGSKNG